MKDELKHTMPGAVAPKDSRMLSYRANNTRAPWC